MSFLALPGTKGGVYRVKVHSSGKDRYWKYDSTTQRIQLAIVDESDKSAGLPFKWYIGPNEDSTAFTICPAYNTVYGLDKDGGKPKGKKDSSAEWLISKDDGKYYSSIKFKGDAKVLGCPDPATDEFIDFYDRVNDDSKNQNFVFQFVESTFEQLWFQLTPQKAAEEQYDIIIVGTGMGGGVIASDLFDTNSKLGMHAKSVLVIEKGGLPFHSHCLNGSRPTGFGEDRGQQNDTFFSLFRENYEFKKAADSAQWKGGPMFNLGGRSAAWGLFVPRIHDENLRKWFGGTLAEDIVNNWYKEAEDLMDVFLPTTNPLHRDLMERLNMKTTDNQCQWQWGRIASQFRQTDNFDFATGAYSPIDKLLEIAMSKARKRDGTCVEHENWKILINTEVRSIRWNSETTPTATGIVVRDASGNSTTIGLKGNGKLILGAGSVGSPAILMRSGVDLTSNEGLRLTDHDIFAATYTFRYLDPSIRKKVGSMKLQSYVRLTDSDKTIALVNAAIDSFSFLPREFLPQQVFTNRDFPKLIFAYILPTKLNQSNTIELVADEPVVTAGRENSFSNADPKVAELRALTKTLVATIKDVLKIELRTDHPSDEKFFKPLELGGVAHELGTVPLQGAKDAAGKYLLNNNLELRGRKGVYVCDLSLFPFSPEVNPTLTLVALALRLSRDISSREFTKAVGSVTVMNHSGDKVKVLVSNLAAASLDPTEENENAQGGKVLVPGDCLTRKREDLFQTKDKYEAVLVHSLEFNKTDEFVSQPVSYVARIGDGVRIQ